MDACGIAALVVCERCCERPVTLIESRARSPTELRVAAFTLCA